MFYAKSFIAAACTGKLQVISQLFKETTSGKTFLCFIRVDFRACGTMDG